MKELIRLQTWVATGRFTLPVVVMSCLSLWGIMLPDWSGLGSLFIVALVGYVMIEANTAFNLIRTRSALPVCIYWLITAVLFSSHPFGWTDLVPLLFIIGVYQLFLSYESPSLCTPVFHTFLSVGIGSIVFPPFLFMVPLLWMSMFPFRAMTGKSFLASLIGLATPYWFLFGYAFWFDEMPVLYGPFQEVARFHSIDYSHLSLFEMASWGFITLLLLVSGFHYWHVSYMDKPRTRIYHTFLAVSGFWAALLSILQPVYLNEWLSIQLVSSAFLSGHLFTLTRNRFSGIFFVVTFVVLMILTVYNLWMQFFNF